MENKYRSAVLHSDRSAFVEDICGMTAQPYRTEADSVGTASKNLANYYRDQFQRLCDFLLSHLSQSLTVEELCSHTGLSRATVNRIFQSCAGMGAMRYFQEMRIREAKRLIRAGGMSMTEIAQQLGFASIHHFSRVFKQTAGITAREYANL